MMDGLAPILTSCMHALSTHALHGNVDVYLSVFVCVKSIFPFYGDPSVGTATTSKTTITPTPT
ncbi:hypothetical protein CSUI_004637, partial [Cystoisospora suis]